MKDINLVPQYVLSERKRQETKGRLLIYGIIFLIILAGASIWPYITIYQLKSQIKTVEVKIDESKNVLEKAERLDKLKKDIKSKEGILDNLKSRETLLEKTLKDVEKQLPKGMKITNISIKGDSISLSGVAENQYAIADLLYNLRTSGKFYGAFVSSLASPVDASGNRQFSTEFNYIDGK